MNKLDKEELWLSIRFQYESGVAMCDIVEVEKKLVGRQSVYRKAGVEEWDRPTVKPKLPKKKVEMVKPIRAYLEKVGDGFKTMLAPFTEADQINRRLILDWNAEQDRKASEAQEIEDAKLELAQREAAFTGTGEHTQELDTIEIPPEAPKIIRTEMGTVSGRVTWKFEVTDFALLPDEYKLPNEQLLRSFANSTKGSREIPGVRIFSEGGLTVRPTQENGA